jgi:hypothetical protein
MARVGTRSLGEEQVVLDGSVAVGDVVGLQPGVRALQVARTPSCRLCCECSE